MNKYNLNKFIEVFLDDDGGLRKLPKSSFSGDGINLLDVREIVKKDEFSFQLLFINNVFISLIEDKSSDDIEVKVHVNNDDVNINILDSYLADGHLAVVENGVKKDLIGYKKLNDNKYFLRFSDPIESERSIDLLNFVSRSETIEVLFESSEESDDGLVHLHGHRRDSELEGLFNKTSKKKSYGDVNVEKENLSTKEYGDFSRDINVDYSEFENHVFFGSAYSKVVNISKKIDEIYNLNQRIDSVDNTVDKNKIEGEIKNIIDSFSGYERYVYNNIWNDSLSEFDNWVSEEKEKAEKYDARNDNFIIYSVPDYFISNDDDNLFTNFILLIGEFMDNIWALVKSIDNVYNFDITSDEMLSEKFIDMMLEDLGFDVDYKYTNEDFKDYFGSEKNMRKVSNQLSKRLLYSLPLLTKFKGTKQSLYSILNIFGIPREFLQVYEFGQVVRSDNVDRTLNEYDWFLDGDQELVGNVPSEDIDFENFTFQFVLRNLSGTGVLLRLDSDNYIEYEVIDDNYVVRFIEGGSIIYESPQIKNNSLWNFINFKKDSSDVGTFVYYTLNTVENGIVEEYEEDFNFATDFVNEVDYPSFDSFNIIDSGKVDITEFRIFNRDLNKRELDYQSLDIRSVAEENNLDDILARFKFYKPDQDLTDSYLDNLATKLAENDPSNDKLYYDNLLDSIYTGYKGGQVIESTTSELMILGTNLGDEKFNKSDFFFTNVTNTSIASMFTTEKVSIIEQVQNFELSSKRNATEYKDVEYIFDKSLLGIFFSPNDLYDKHLFRKVGLDTDFVIDDNTEYDYSFENLMELKDYEKRIRYDFFKENVIYNILEMFNIKVYNVLKEFTPASANVMSGLFIKNSILDKSKAIKRDSTMTHMKTPKANIDGDFVKTSSKGSKAKVDIIIDQDIEINSAKKVKEIIITTYKGDRSKFILPIESFKDQNRSPWLVRMIRGVNESTRLISSEEVESVLNKGARILIK